MVSGDRYGSTTDLITNLTTFPQVNLRADILDMFRLGPSPSRHLQSFLHEATHHWCFHSSVGAALSTLTLRARIDAARLLHESTKDREPVLGRLIRTLTLQRVAHACLGPFIEGLALFAEFDSTPRIRTRVRSVVMENVAFYFGMPVPGTSSNDTVVLFGDSAEGIPDVQQEVDRWLMLTLAKSRMTPTCVDRKANILVHPFDVTSGYLPGYLFVKALWDGLARRAPRLRNETDLLLTYLRHHVFEDAALVRILLSDSETDPEVIASTVAQSIDMRFEALLDVRPEMVDQFERRLDSDGFTLDDPQFLWSVQVEPADRYAAREEFETIVATFGNRPKDEQDFFGMGMHMAWQAAMQGRAFVSMGTMPLTFAVEDQRFICPELPELESSVNGASPLWLSGFEAVAGTAELLFARGDEGFPTRLLLFCAADKVLGLVAIPGTKPHQLRSWVGMLHQRSAAAANVIRASGQLLEMVRPILVESTAFGDVERALATRVSAMYMPWSLVGVRDEEARSRLAETMRRGGLRGVLGSSVDVRALAALSLSVMRNPRIEFVEADLAARGFSAADVLARFTTMHEEQGFPWVQVSGGAVLAVV